MKSTSLTILCALTLCGTFSACGGGGSGTSMPTGSSPPPSAPPPPPPPPPPVVNQSLGGIWEADTPVNGVEVKVLALVSEDGRFFEEAVNQTNNCASVATGSVVANGSSFSGTAISALVLFTTDSSIQAGCQYLDGSNDGSAVLSGTVAERSTLTLTSVFTTSAGTVEPSATATLTFNSLYNEPSSLANLAGNWTGPTGVVTTINSDGTFFAQDPSSGCTVNGAYTIINATYNAYAGSAIYANCQGNAAVLNGLTATGLVTLDDTVSPNQLVGGVSVKLPSGVVIIAVATATR